MPRGPDEFDRMAAKEEFIDLVARGASPVNAGVQVGWSPQHTRKMLKDEEFADLVMGSVERANGSIEEALYARAMLGNVTAMQMWLFNRAPDRWRDVRRIEVHADHRVEVRQVASTKTAVLELLREHGAGVMQALEAGTIYDAEVVDGNQD